MKAPKERDVQRQCLEWLKLHGVPAYRQNSGGALIANRGSVGSHFVRFASVDGISDIIAILPPHGRYTAIECKAPRGKVRPSQEAFLESVRRAGGVGIVVRSVDELAAQLGPYLEG